MNEKEILEFKNRIAANLNNKFPKFEEKWDKIGKTQCKEVKDAIKFIFKNNRRKR